MNEKGVSPLCVFTLSPPFRIQEFVRSSKEPASRRPSTPFWRRSDYSLPRIRPRFKPFKQTTNTLAKYLTGRIRSLRKESLSLQDVLSTIKYVWTSPNSFIKSSSSLKMDEHHQKKSSASSDVSSPILLRRRLSAPETIMRKHTLAQQRSDSQESVTTQGSDVRSCQWRADTGIGSDSSLNKKRDHGIMRKSTLMRRLWGSKPDRNSRLSGSFSDWQHGKLGRSSQSLGSTHSSPEHRKWKSRASLNSDKFKTSPVHKRHDSPKMLVKNQTEKDGQSSCYKTVCCSNCTYATTFENPTTTTETESENYTTRSTRSTTTTGTTTFSDNSDSAYNNSNSNFTQTSNEPSSICSTTYSSERFLEENGNAADNENANELRLESTPPEKLTTNKARVDLNNFNDSSTQTADTTNLNVISNVQLSQSTLNLIFNQVMQDVQKSPPTNLNISTISAEVPLKTNESKLIQVQQIPSFYLKRKETAQVEEKAQILKYTVGNVGTGSPYSKPQDIPQVVVPRYSALPRTTSMEVNTSSGESTDKESDNVSLVDSLEDPSSPRIDVNRNKYDEKPVRGDLSPVLPDNSNDKHRSESKSSAFFVPIKNNEGLSPKSVADHLPDKVREKLSRRQVRREQKLKQNKLVSPKSDSNYVSASDNGNQLHHVIDNAKYANDTFGHLPEINKSKRRSKPTLPSIESMKKNKIDSRATSDRIKERKLNKPTKKKIFSKPKELENPTSDTKHNWMIPKSRRVLERLYPICSSKTEYVYDVVPKKVYHKTELSNLNKRIEILEIVECIETIPSGSRMSKSKRSRISKIPVLMNSKLPSITKESQAQKPVYLDFNQVHENEPKIDQLIANILIDALNKTETAASSDERRKSPQVIEKIPPITQPSSSRHSGNKYQQTFESIPEERTASIQSSSEDTWNNNERNADRDDTANSDNPDGYKGKAAIDSVKDDNLSTIPKGWITFYTLHKSQGSPESTSDEGKKIRMENENKNGINEENKNMTSGEVEINENVEKTHDAHSKHLSQNSLDSLTSSEQDQSTRTILHPLTTSGYGPRHQSQKRTRSKTTGSSTTDGWSVTVSGSTSGGHFAPDLEMRLTFPRNSKNSAIQHDLQVEDKNRNNFPYLTSSKGINRTASRICNSCEMQPLPHIMRHGSKQTRREDIKDYTKIEPRHTRTSSRRLLLNRPRTFISPAEFIDIETTDGKLKEILEKFPQILSITGNAISPERKPRVLTMTERNVIRHIYRDN